MQSLNKVMDMNKTWDINEWH